MGLRRLHDAALRGIAFAVIVDIPLPATQQSNGGSKGPPLGMASVSAPPLRAALKPPAVEAADPPACHANRRAPLAADFIRLRKSPKSVEAFRNAGWDAGAAGGATGWSLIVLG